MTDIDNTMYIHTRLKLARLALGLKQTDIAKELNIQSNFLSNIERGAKVPPKRLIELFSARYKVNANWIFTGEGAMLISHPEYTAFPTGHQIPLLRQKVSCGPGQHWEDETNIDRYVNIFDFVPRLKTGRVYAVPVSGSSMLGAGIRHGDIVLFEAANDQVTHDGVYVFSLDGDVYCKRLEFDALTRQIKVFSVRVADLEKAELAMTFKADDPALADRLHIFGRVFMWIHPENQQE